MKKIVNRIGYGIVIACMVFVLYGCNKEGNLNILNQEEPKSMLEIPDLSYDVPQQIPGILVNLSGYDIANKKILLVHGKQVPESFKLINAETKQIVYEAKLVDKAYNANTKEYNSYGDFSDYVIPGEYYIQCEILGSSYPFVLKENRYQTQFSDVFKGIVKQTQKEDCDIKELCDTAASLLLAYELYPKIHEDGTIFEKNGIPDILDEVAFIVAKLSEKQEIKTGKVEDISDCYAGVLAKFGYHYKKYDNKYATECLKAADLAYQYTISEKEKISKNQHFFAATELYRATGKKEYHKEAKKVISDQKNEDVLADDYWLYGTVTYLSTKRKVDVDLCTTLMQTLMAKAEDIIVISEESIYLAFGEKEEADQILSNMTLLSVADFISTNQEYALVIGNQYHYLYGRNPWSIQLLDDNSMKHKGKLIMALSQMLQVNLEYKE